MSPIISFSLDFYKRLGFTTKKSGEQFINTNPSISSKVSNDTNKLVSNLTKFFTETCNIEIKQWVQEDKDKKKNEKKRKQQQLVENEQEDIKNKLKEDLREEVKFEMLMDEKKKKIKSEDIPKFIKEKETINMDNAQIESLVCRHRPSSNYSP